MADNKEAAKLLMSIFQEFPESIQIKLSELKGIIEEAAPEATEKFSYQMPTYYLKGNLVHFAVFKEQLKEYKTAKGSIQFPLDKPLPTKLIEKIMTFRISENLGK